MPIRRLSLVLHGASLAPQCFPLAFPLAFSLSFLSNVRFTILSTGLFTVLFTDLSFSLTFPLTFPPSFPSTGRFTDLYHRANRRQRKRTEAIADEIQRGSAGAKPTAISTEPSRKGPLPRAQSQQHIKEGKAFCSENSAFLKHRVDHCREHRDSRTSRRGLSCTQSRPQAKASVFRLPMAELVAEVQGKAASLDLRVRWYTARPQWTTWRTHHNAHTNRAHTCTRNTAAAARPEVAARCQPPGCQPLTTRPMDSALRPAAAGVPGRSDPREPRKTPLLPGVATGFSAKTRPLPCGASGQVQTCRAVKVPAEPGPHVMGHPRTRWP